MQSYKIDCMTFPKAKLWFIKVSEIAIQLYIAIAIFSQVLLRINNGTAYFYHETVQNLKAFLPACHSALLGKEISDMCIDKKH